MARREAALESVLEAAWLRLPDGAPVAWLQRRLGHTAAERVGGPDLMVRVLELSVGSELRHFFLGSTPEVLAAMQKRVDADYPGATVAGTLSPPFGPLETALGEDVLLALRPSNPHVVWVGLGAPKQEYWMRHVSAEVPAALFVGVGAAFDFLAGTRPRAPRFMRKLGLEWSYRLALEPRRLFGRYVRTNSEFMVHAFAELLRRRV